MSQSLYFSLVVLILGGCIGSFLNVVIYRWPRDLLVSKPTRSFCPACNTTLSWHDNIPVLSYLWLRGRCRYCQVPISVQYPLIELATAMLFLMIFDALFVGRLRFGVGQLPADWPILIAHWVLVAGLIALAIMDLEAYLVDIRVTRVVVLAGLVGHMLWTPAHGGGVHSWLRPGPIQAGVALAATVGLAIGAWLFLRQSPEQDPADEPVKEAPEVDSLTAPNTQATMLRWVWILLPLVLVVVYTAAMQRQVAPPVESAPGSALQWPSQPAPPMPADADMAAIRLGLGLAFMFVAMALAASQPHPDQDNEIVEAIEAESVSARRNALWELKLLAPAILLSAAVLFVFVTQPAARDAFSRGLDWRPIAGWQWQPVLGLATGLAGWIIGGAVAWGARIFFTLVFGKEALGMGDVHILAAAGAVAGWPVAFLGFFLAAPLALLAILVIRIRRQSRALPYGPWLGMGFLVVVIFQDQILNYLHIRQLLE